MANTLIVYDTTGPFGWIGELYAILTANLASRFGTWTAQPASSYRAGQMLRYNGVIYLGATFNEPIAPSFFADVQTYQSTPVIWAGYNIWQLTAAAPGFQQNYGWLPGSFDLSSIATVSYKGQQLKRFAANGNGIMDYAALSAPATVLAVAARADGSTLPWAVRSRNLTYIGEMPFAFMSEGDRYLAFCDLLFDALAPSTPTTRQALVRVEDIHARTNPALLRQIADYFDEQDVPFGFQIIPYYIDPNGTLNGGAPVSIHLKDAPTLIDAMAYMQSRNGTLIGHGYTHQYSTIANPYSAVSGENAEFYLLQQDGSGGVSYVRPVPENSRSWVEGRLSAATAEYNAAFQSATGQASYRRYRTGGANLPSFWTSPNYAASADAYRVFSAAFDARAERSLYFAGLLSNPRQTPDPTRLAGQYMPFVVPNDVYGGKVLPDTLGPLQPSSAALTPLRTPADVIADAQRNLVVRDAWATFYFHADDWDTGPSQNVQTTIAGLKQLGYSFRSFDFLS